MKRDLSVFDSIPSQTTPEDRSCLLALQDWLREQGDCVYLEIGSHLGGTIQPYYADPACKVIYSIDKRPISQPDERGERFAYPENSTAVMRENLRRVFPDADDGKLRTFDCDASEMDAAVVDPRPGLCLIDGEHTNAALKSDMRFCLQVVDADGVICMHDSGVVGDGILEMQRELRDRGIPFTGVKPGGSVYVFALGQSGTRLREMLADELQDEAHYFKGAAFYRRRLQMEARFRRWPCLLRVYMFWTRFADWLYVHVFNRVLSITARRGDR